MSGRENITGGNPFLNYVKVLTLLNNVYETKSPFYAKVGAPLGNLELDGNYTVLEDTSSGSRYSRSGKNQLNGLTIAGNARPRSIQISFLHFISRKIIPVNISKSIWAVVSAMIFAALFFSANTLQSTSQAAPDDRLWMNKSFPPLRRAQFLVKAMTLDEKAEQIQMADVKSAPREIPGIPRLAIPTFKVTNGSALYMGYYRESLEGRARSFQDSRRRLIAQSALKGKH